MLDAEIVLNQPALQISRATTDGQRTPDGYLSPENFVDEMMIAFRVVPPGDLSVDTSLNSRVLKPVYAALGPPRVGLFSPETFDLFQRFFV